MKRLSSPQNCGKNRLLSALTGFFAGMINGLFGGGGGMLVVPMLGDFLGYEKKSAHATAILIILPISILSGLIYSATGSLDTSVLFPVFIGTLIGGAFGAVFLSKFPTKVVALIFSAVMFLAGVKTAFF